jgi:hypothetical protein
MKTGFQKKHLHDVQRMAAGKGESDIYCPPEYPMGIEDAQEMRTRLSTMAFLILFFGMSRL